MREKEIEKRGRRDVGGIDQLREGNIGQMIVSIAVKRPTRYYQILVRGQT